MRKNRQTAKYHIKNLYHSRKSGRSHFHGTGFAGSCYGCTAEPCICHGQAQIQPMGDGSGKYMMKSDGFYCLDVNGDRKYPGRDSLFSEL